MRCPSLSALPPPPPGAEGWPWTEESTSLETAVENRRPGRVTVITPSFNQGRFLEATIRSVLLQGYPDLEYFVLDGGSRDNSIEIIRKYSQWITFWVSEADGGQSAAINRGLRMGSGVFANWINSDDMLCKNALTTLVGGTKLEEDTLYVGDCIYIDETGRFLSRHRGRVRTLDDIVRIPSVWRSGGSIDQPAVLFPLKLVLDVGALNQQNHYTMDYELWGKLLLADSRVEYTHIPFAFFRWYEEQKTRDSVKQTESLLETGTALIMQATSLSEQLRSQFLSDLQAYRIAYPTMLWKQSGMLARLGLPPSLVKSLRALRKTVETRLGSFIGSGERNRSTLVEK